MKRMMILTALLAVAPVAARSEPGLGLPLSMDLARAAYDDCVQRGMTPSASVVDEKGMPLVVLRSEANPRTPAIAPRKAATAVQFDAPGSDMEPRMKTDPAFAALINAEPWRLNPHGGSLPLHVKGRLVGGLAIGDVAHDVADQCVRAAVAKYADRLR
jgi:uncharacterized protein GlcG (DUF336 family)